MLPQQLHFFAIGNDRMPLEVIHALATIKSAAASGELPQAPDFTLERLDEDDNRLLSVSAAIGWSPKLAMLMTLNVPIYLYGR